MSISHQTSRPSSNSYATSIKVDGQCMEVLTPPVGRNVNELTRQVKAFQHVRATGEATPSGWQPGRPTLKPSPQLTGKVWEV